MMKRFATFIALAFLIFSSLLVGGSLNQVRADGQGCDNGGVPGDCVVVFGTGWHVRSVSAQGRVKNDKNGEYRVYKWDLGFNSSTLLANSSLTTLPGDKQLHGKTYTNGGNGWDFTADGWVCAGFYTHNIPNDTWSPVYNFGNNPKGACVAILN